MALGNGFHQGQAQTHTAVALCGTRQSVKRLKNSLLQIRWYARTAVTDPNHGKTGGLAQAQGDFTGRVEWAIAAYAKKSLALDHVARAAARSVALIEKYKTKNAIPPKANQFDPGMRLGYFGVHYFCETVALKSAIPSTRHGNRSRL